MVSPNGLPIKVVSRPSKWANPYKLEEYRIEGTENKSEIKRIQRGMAVRDFAGALYMASPPDPISGWMEFTYDDIKRELKGFNLACWCPLDEPCHADVLLAVANEVDPVVDWYCWSIWSVEGGKGAKAITKPAVLKLERGDERWKKR